MSNKSKVKKVMEMFLQCNNMKAAKAMIDFAHPEGEMANIAVLFFFEEDEEFADLVNKFIIDMDILKNKKRLKKEKE